ncbi:MAG: HlyD family type I secretion periplasmic adaptor subunit [Devosia sp.]
MSISSLSARAWPGRRAAREGQQDGRELAMASSASIEEIHDAGVARSAIRLVSLGLIAFLVWASFAPVPEIATGFGEIVPVEQNQNIQHLEGGIVAQIFVKEGERVERGQPILRLDDLAPKAELAKATSHAEGIRLEIERRAANRQNPVSVLDGPLQLRGPAGTEQPAALADEAFRKAQIEVALAEVEVRKADLSSLAQRQENASGELAIIARQLAAFDNAVKTVGAASNQRDNIAREKIQLENAVLTSGSQRATAQAALLQAQAHVHELQAGFRQAAEAEIADFQVQAASAQELVTQLQDRVDRTLILAPQTGRVLGLVANNPGQVITPGEQIATLIPEGQPTLAEVEIPADQIGFVSLGMAANVKVLTFDYTRFGSMPATVTSISASSLKHDPKSAPYFLVRLALDPASLAHLSLDRPIHSGMSVVGDIKLGEKSVLSFLLKPLRSLSDRALTQQ